MQSRIRIGLATPAIYVHTSGHRGLSEPIPNLLRAYPNAESKRKHLEVMKDVRLILLPPLLRVSSPLGARIWARLFSLDYLIWCNVVSDDPEVAHTFLRPSVADAAEEPQEDMYGNQYQWSLFETSIEDLRLDPPALALDTNQLTESYALLLLSITVSLCKRGRRADQNG